MKNSSAQIFLLQETHSVLADEEGWVIQWGGKIYFSHSTNSARGVAILIKSSISASIVRIDRDNEGGLLISEIEVLNMELAIANIYAPNEDNPTFFQNLFH